MTVDLAAIADLIAALTVAPALTAVSQAQAIVTIGAMTASMVTIAAVPFRADLDILARPAVFVGALEFPSAFRD